VQSGVSSAVTEAYVHTINQQLADLEPSIVALNTAEDTGPTAFHDLRQHRIRRHRLMLGRYAMFKLHLLYTLVGGQWDKQTLLDNAEAYLSTPRFHDALRRSCAAADTLSELRALDPDYGFKALYFGIAFFHAATLPFIAVTHLKQNVGAQVLAACDTYVRVFEATNCTFYAEYLVCMICACCC
jgi:hypothetical protein